MAFIGKDITLNFRSICCPAPLQPLRWTNECWVIAWLTLQKADWRWNKEDWRRSWRDLFSRCRVSPRGPLFLRDVTDRRRMLYLEPSNMRFKQSLKSSCFLIFLGIFFRLSTLSGFLFCPPDKKKNKVWQKCLYNTPKTRSSQTSAWRVHQANLKSNIL